MKEVIQPPKPFLRWAGGKRQLLPHLFKVMSPWDFSPEGQRTYAMYYEPFVGGGALFFAMRAMGWKGPAVLGDANGYLMMTYRAIRDEAPSTIAALRVMAAEYDRRGEEYYYRQRHVGFHSGGGPVVAARFILLNKTGFNGLWRVNKAGEYNVPHGKRKSPPVIYDAKGLYEASEALKNTRLESCDFEKLTANASKGDLVYFDPPYPPVSHTSDFTTYTADGFSWSEHVRLAAVARRLKRRGVRVIVSNAATPAVEKLYEGFCITRVEARRNINSKGNRRGPVREFIII